MFGVPIRVRFSISKMFGNDAESVYGNAFDLPVEIRNKPALDRFALSGLEDFYYTCTVAQEYTNRNFPLITYREVDRTNVDPLYNEPATGELTFERDLKFKPMVKYRRATTENTKEGVEQDQAIFFHIPLLTCWELDLTPALGDVFIHLGKRWQIKDVYLDPNSMIGQTGMPTFISTEAQYMRFGDELPTHSLASRYTSRPPANRG